MQKFFTWGLHHVKFCVFVNYIHVCGSKIPEIWKFHTISKGRVIEKRLRIITQLWILKEFKLFTRDQMASKLSALVLKPSLPRKHIHLLKCLKGLFYKHMFKRKTNLYDLRAVKKTLRLLMRGNICTIHQKWSKTVQKSHFQKRKKEPRESLNVTDHNKSSSTFCKRPRRIRNTMQKGKKAAQTGNGITMYHDVTLQCVHKHRP